MEIYKSGANFGQMDQATVSGTKVNTLCGDKMVVQLKIVDGKILDAKFNGIACAVSKTSASIITEHIKGKNLKELTKITEKDILELIMFDITSARKQCALLCYHALQKALTDYEKEN